MLDDYKIWQRIKSADVAGRGREERGVNIIVLYYKIRVEGLRVIKLCGRGLPAYAYYINKLSHVGWKPTTTF
jgi:hypothetical protein